MKYKCHPEPGDTQYSKESRFLSDAGKQPAKVKMCYRRTKFLFPHCFTHHNQNYYHSDFILPPKPHAAVQVPSNCHSASCKPYRSELIQLSSGYSSEAGFVSYTMLLSTLQRPQTWLITFAWDPPSTQHIVENCWSRATVATFFTPGISQTCHSLFKVPLTGQIYSS